MTIDNKLFFLAIVVVGVGIAFWWHQTRPAHAQSESKAVPWRPQWLNLEDKAKQAENNEPESVRALVDEVFSKAHGFRRLPPVIEDSLKERIVKAELNYRHGIGRPVKESDIVQLANSFADKFALPAFAKTSEHQLRDLRLRSMVFNPTFMGKGVIKGEVGIPMQIGDSINPTVSPLQAVYLTMFLIDSKLINADYQMAPDDWEADQYQKGVAEWKRAQLAKALDSDGNVRAELSSHRELVMSVNTKIVELKNAFENASLALNQNDALNLAQSALDTLGIEGGNNWH